ncbi:hypothetical protein N4G70_28825 [Streptomyces sp. ASQP_92]|uniref:hypothetical protein n=1 Tax=Streptomyces sp. ASQP_92 TaxID=2979116 RepID=UPI0021BDF096|nr:hypothetical protein [Streptomyces sp. ASQP_92]MCT9092844.1 hypothetical protein [Streptomyces sp. ASQP_92]
MRQRNTTPYAWHFAVTPATDDQPEQAAFSVESGEVADRPQLLDGWTAVEDEPEPQHDKNSIEAAKARPRKSASVEDSKGGEPQ